MSAALQCVLSPAAACITEHMFSTQEPEQKGLFVIIHSFVDICSPPRSHPLACPSIPSFRNIQTKDLMEISRWGGGVKPNVPEILLVPPRGHRSPTVARTARGTLSKCLLTVRRALHFYPLSLTSRSNYHKRGTSVSERRKPRHRERK